MSVELIKILTDEMISPRLADDMRHLGYDALSCQRAGRANRGISDEDQLELATANGRAIYTFNGVDYLALHRAWQAVGRVHAGIIVSVDLNSQAQEMIRRLRLHMDTVRPNIQRNSLMILWP